MITIEQLVERIARYVSRECQHESRFLYSEPCHAVDAAGLLDAVSEASGVSKEQIGRWVDDEQDLKFRALKALRGHGQP